MRSRRWLSLLVRYVPFLPLVEHLPNYINEGQGNGCSSQGRWPCSDRSVSALCNGQQLRDPLIGNAETAGGAIAGGAVSTVSAVGTMRWRSRRRGHLRTERGWGRSWSHRRLGQSCRRFGNRPAGETAGGKRARRVPLPIRSPLKGHPAAPGPGPGTLSITGGSSRVGRPLLTAQPPPRSRRERGIVKRESRWNVRA